MPDNQEIAQNGLLAEMDKAKKRNLRITNIRMNFKTLTNLFFGTTDLFFEAKKRGLKDWPIGAFAPIDKKYGKEGYFVLDNTIDDGDILIDTVKE